MAQRAIDILACEEDSSDFDMPDASPAASMSPESCPAQSVTLTPNTQPSKSAKQVQSQADDAVYEGQLHELERACWEACNNEGPCSTSSPAWAGVSASLRASAVDWMVDAAWQLMLTSDTLFLGVQLFDRYLVACPGVLQSTPALSARVQLLSITCLWVAAKYEEASSPRATCFLQVVCPSMPSALPGLHKQMLSLERHLLAALHYRLSLPTCKTFLRKALHLAPVDRQAYFLAGYLAELCLLERGLLAALPSKVAAACYMWALVLLGRQPQAPEILAATGYTPSDLTDQLLFVSQLHALISNASRKCAIFLKYSTAEMQAVATLQLPAPDAPHAAALKLACAAATPTGSTKVMRL